MDFLSAFDIGTAHGELLHFGSLLAVAAIVYLAKRQLRSLETLPEEVRELKERVSYLEGRCGVIRS